MMVVVFIPFGVAEGHLFKALLADGDRRERAPGLAAALKCRPAEDNRGYGY